MLRDCWPVFSYSAAENAGVADEYDRRRVSKSPMEG